ncbi:MAG: SDR family NAD(P)-dependent oxidoreductase [Halieaceae bacterium]
MTTHKTTALVTGASSGLGAEFCRQLAQRCEVIIAVARREDRLREIASELKGEAEVHVVVADLATVEGVTRTVEALRQKGPVDILVNNAGFGTFGAMVDGELSQQLNMIRLHVDATVELSNAAIPFMQALGGGHIVNVASVAALLPMKDTVVYGASKAFVASFSRSLQEEVRAAGIQVQCLCPGFTRTEMHASEGFGNFDIARTPEAMWMESDAVVAASLAALDEDRVLVIPGEVNQGIVRTALENQLDLVGQ